MLKAMLDDLWLKRDRLKRFYPAVHPLEARLTPSGGGTTKTWMYSGSTPGEWNVAGNWSGNAVPTADDDVKFDGSAGTGTGDCNWGDAGGVAPHSISFLSTFNGTLDLFADEEISGDVNLDGGNIWQAASKTLTVDGTFERSAGSVDKNSQAVANLSAGTVDISGPSFSCYDTWTIRSGSTATFHMSGTVTFGGGTGIVIQNGATWTWNSGSIGSSGGGYLSNSGNFKANLGATNSSNCQLPIVNTAASASLRMSSGTLYVTGARNGLGISQTNGTTIIYAGAHLDAGSGFTMSGGYLYTYGSGFAVLVGVVTIDGGEIDLNANNANQCGELDVDGSLTIISGTVVVKLDTTNNSCDSLLATGGIWIGDASTLTASNINIPQGGIPNGRQFSIMSTFAGTEIDGNFGPTNLTFNGGTWVNSIVNDANTGGVYILTSQRS